MQARTIPFSLLTLVVFSTIIYLLKPFYNIDNGISYETDSSRTRRPFSAPSRNVWSELDENEALELYEYLKQSSAFANLTWSSTTPGNGSFLNLVELLRPNKSDVIDYMHNEGPTPERWARVSVFENQEKEAFLVEYMVGPLPPSKKTQILPLSYPYNAGRNYVQSPLYNIFSLYEWTMKVGDNISDITQDLLGATTNRLKPSDPNALFMGSRAVVIEEGLMVHWIEFYRSGLRSGARSMLPQGLYFKLIAPSPDPATWEITEWFYNDVLYSDLEAFRRAWSSPGFERISINYDGSWTDTEDFVSSPDGRELPPPLSIQPLGPRYKLDRKQNYVSWMGFTFYLSTSSHFSLSLFDVRYNNSRIMYSIGLQEALSHYAGSEPLQSGLEFLDAFFGMGSMSFSLVPGYDCPSHAEYLDMTYHKNGKFSTNKNAICIFEYTSDAPLQRHTSAYGATVSRNTYLVVRSVSTVGNYDYTFDYIFYLDGSIEVKLRASGYIFAAFAGQPQTPTHDTSLAKRSEYGYRIHESAKTSMHDHVISFRADLDIDGPTNRVIRTDIKPLIKTYPWDRPEVPTSRNTMHLTHQVIQNETGMDWPPNSAAMYLIESNSTNIWGERRAYRIQPGTGMGTPIHLTIENSTTLGRSAAWATSDLWFLRTHDHEPAGAHENNYISANNPLIDFGKMVDGESIENEDLVVFFNLGGHHVPSSQDIPNTLMHTSASSVMFVPFNFFDDDVSRTYRQGVRIDRRPKDPELDVQKGEREKEDKYKDDPQVKYFGARYMHGVDLKAKQLEPDLSDYMRGDFPGDWVKNNVQGGAWGMFGEWAD